MNQSPYNELLALLAENREERVLEIQVTAGDPTYADEDDTVIDQPYHFALVLHEGGLWYGYEGMPEGYSHQAPRVSQRIDGAGATLDEAAAEVLRCRAEWEKWLGDRLEAAPSDVG